MTPDEERLHALLRSRIQRLQPDVARAWIRVVEILRRTLDLPAIERLIADGRFDTIVNTILSDESLDRVFLQLREAMRESTADAFRLNRAALPGQGMVAGVPAIAFDVVSPRVTQALTTLERQILAPAKTAVRETVRQSVVAGVQQGMNPRELARGIRDAVGLAPHQEQAVRNFEAALRRGDFKKALRYQLRDRRFDATVKKGAYTNAQIDRMVAAYRKKFEAHHAETIARTATLNAYRAGQHESYAAAIDAGIVDRNRARKTWVNVGDDRVRDEHLDKLHGGIAGETVPFDALFSNGLLYPMEYNCRCFLRYWQAPRGA